MNLLAIFLGGGAGALARYGFSAFIARHMGTGFPWGTLAVNLLGAFLMGLIVELLALKIQLPPSAKLLLTTGFLGGFTTFSAFSLESALMWQKGDWLPLSLYTGVSVLGTVAALLIAMQLVRSLP